MSCYGDDSIADDVNSGAHVAGMTADEVTQYYNTWALQGTYEQHLNSERYRGPRYAAEAVARYCKAKDAHILDIAAGTGLVGYELAKLGYYHIDALEPAADMLELARQKGVYSQFICQRVEHTSNVARGTYDVVVTSGGMGEGHIPSAALADMAHITKTGGIVCIAMREAYLSTVADYRERLEPLMLEMEEKGVWRKLARDVLPKYSFDNNGVIFVFQTL